jgi:L-alanine-DL-glutamate epimerase-like enolase superfamily enzyme
VRVTAVRILTLAHPLATPVRTSFGVMRQRHAILVEVRTDAGLSGWGESFANFPSWAPFERIRTLGDGLAPLLLGEDPREPERLHGVMRRATATLARQWGAPGPIAQAISALDIALWDLLGQVRGEPIHRLLGSAERTHVPVYASALGPQDPAPLVAEAQARGIAAFKLKVGFGDEIDRRNLARMRELIGPDAQLMVDANQAWDLEQARAAAGLLAQHDVAWLEEPLAADRWHELAQLRREVSVPLAAGENLTDLASGLDLLALDPVDVVQPDVCKIGGLTEARALIEGARARGVPFAPHYLGAAVGLIASLHLFAALPGGVLMELDPNPNPLREALGRGLLDVVDGALATPQRPGLGLVPDEAWLRRYLLDERVVRA